jgi:hypothetical protein
MKTGLGVLAVLTMLTPVSDTVPRIDSDRFCTHIETRLDLPQRPRSACLQDEEVARGQVTALWATAKPASRTQCASTQALAPHPSYASLLTCVQMAEGIVIRPANPK